MRDEVGPVLGAGIVDRGGDDLEVLGAIGICADVEKAIALVDVIFPIRHPGRDQARRAARLGVDQPAFAGLVVMRIDDDEPVAERTADADEEAGIGLLEDDRVTGLIGADRVQAHAVGPVIVVILGIVDGAGIVAPDIGAGRFGDDFGAVLAGL